ncbi:MAG: Stk1 family PASTA domain-containing Ser/Thr kinase [Clostridia bacterium]|nr:Stk1 family PASTA domain-containing Ser/Thr kinase [Clostridia bacterium]
MNLIGKVLSGRYEILEEIGVGGMAYVYKAKSRLLNRFVAVKVLKEEFAQDDIFVKRFIQEAQAAAALTHPNIVSVYDLGKEDGINYIVMELMEGKTLKDYVEQRGALPENEIYKISSQIASALEAAHKQHIIHRDIKPQNIVLSSGLVAKVTDFGIAKVTSTATITNLGSTMGSVHYFSPEHAKGGYTDEKSDIYSLGVVMYEMATGKVPFDSDSPVSVALKHIQELPKEPKSINPKISDALNDIIMKAMEKIAANRFRSATEMLEAIHDAEGRKSIKRNDSAIEAGKTQVLSVITDDMLNSNPKVPNLRTRNSVGSPNSYSDSIDSRRKREEDINRRNIERRNEDNILENNQRNINESRNDVRNVKENKKKNDKIVLIISIILIVVAIALAVFFVVKIVKKASGTVKIEEIEIPNVLGMTVDEIKEKYSSDGIIVEQTKIEYSSEYEAGKVISQSPTAGSTSKTKKIYVVVSRGQNLVKVTDVEGKDLKVAKYELEDTLGFKVEVEYEKSEEVVSGNVISQSVKPGEEAQAGSKIILKVSEGDGKAKVLMPNVVGMTRDEAVKALEDLKLSVTTETGEDKTKANGVVISQSYLQNYELKEGDVVTITINKTVTSKTITIDVQDLLSKAGVSTKVEEEETEEITDAEEKSDDDSSTKKTTTTAKTTVVPTATILVTASIDGGATNTVYSATVKVTDTSASFTINGYSSAVLNFFVNGSSKPVDTKTITF